MFSEEDQESQPPLISSKLSGCAPSEGVLHGGADVDAGDAAVLDVRLRAEVHEVHPEVVDPESGRLQVLRLLRVGGDESHLTRSLRAVWVLSAWRKSSQTHTPDTGGTVS